MICNRLSAIRSKLGMCVVVASVLAAYGTAFGQQKRDVTIAQAPLSFAAAIPRLSHEMGLFAKHGLEPKFVVTDSGSAANAALISKSVDFSLAGPGEIIISQAKGLKVVEVANGYAGMGGSVVLSKAVAEKLGIAANAPAKDRLKALDGLLIGSASPTANYTIALKGAVESTGATVRFAFMSAAASPAALESGAIQGYIAGAPFWAIPVVKGTGVLWLRGPKGDLPAANTAANTSSLQALREFAEANPDVVKRVAAVFADFAKAVEERPAEVRAMLSKVFSSFDAPTLDLLFAEESVAWKGRPPNVEDMARTIAFVKTLGAPIDGIDKLDPKALIFP